MKYKQKTKWESEKEFKSFVNFLRPKLKKLFAKGYFVYWDEESNWISIRKFLGVNKNNNYMRIDLHAKVFTRPSTFGINNGRVSKLEIRERGDYPNQAIDLKCHYNYDRGLDVNNLRKHAIAKKMYDDFLSIMDSK